MKITKEYKKQKKENPNIVICIYTNYSFFIYDNGILQNLQNKERYSIKLNAVFSFTKDLLKKISNDDCIIIIITEIDKALDLFLSSFKEHKLGGILNYKTKTFKNNIFTSWVQHLV